MSEKYSFRQLIDAGHLELGDGYRTKRSEHGKPGIPILRVAEVQDGKITPEFGDHVSQAFRAAMGTKISQPGDLVLTTKGTVGRSAIIPDDGQEFVYSPQVCYFRLSKSCPVLAKYLYYWLRGSEFWAQANPAKSQTDMADYISLADIRSFTISAPHFAVQRAIAEVLGALDDKIAVNDRVAETSLKLALSIYSELSSSWPGVAARDSATWLSGGTPRTSEPAYWDGDIPWISAKSLRSPWIFESDRNVTQTGANNGTRWAREGSVVFVVRGSSLDAEFRIGLTIRDVTFGQDCKALIPREGIDPTILFLAFKARTSDILKLVDHAGHGAGRLSTDLIGGLEIRLPDPSDNENAVHQLRPLVRLGAEKRQENRVLAQLRDTLLPKLMSGEIRIRDAEKAVEEVT